MTTLNEGELDFILKSLSYTRKSFEEYQNYPSYEFKQGQLKTVNDVMEKVRAVKKELQASTGSK